jgi:hypothetical protein
VILSHRWKFIFIKGRKVAGTSVEIALSSLCGPDDIVTPITPIDEVRRIEAGHPARNYSADRPGEIAYLAEIQRQWSAGYWDISLPMERFYHHMSLTEVLDAVDHDISDYRVFCVERSPYAKVLSWLNMIVSWDSYIAGDGMGGRISALREIIDDYFERGDIGHTRNIDLYRDRAGDVRLTALPYGTLEPAFAELLGSFGIAPVPPLPHVKKGLMSDSIDPLAVFSRAQIDRINEVYDEEFGTFGHPRL